MTTKPTPDIYVVSLMDPFMGTLLGSDVVLHLENALEKVYWHLGDFGESAVVEVDRVGKVISEVRFLNEENELISCIERRTLTDKKEDMTVKSIADALGCDGDSVPSCLTKAFKI